MQPGLDAVAPTGGGELSTPNECGAHWPELSNGSGESDRRISECLDGG